MEPYVTVENIETKTQAWLEHIRPHNQHKMRLNAATSAMPSRWKQAVMAQRG